MIHQWLDLTPLSHHLTIFLRRFLPTVDSSPGLTVRSSRRWRAWKSHFRAATNFGSKSWKFCWNGQSVVVIHEIGFKLWENPQFGWNLVHQILGNHETWFWAFLKVGRLLDEVDKLNSRHPADYSPPSRANEPSPSRNKIPRSQNRLMWQSGFTVTAGRPFRVAR